jgi:DNA-binding NarL/FixJ family response regulator
MNWISGTVVPMLMRKNVMIVDPSPIFRRQLKQAIQTNETLVNVSEAENADQANDILRKQLPDVVFLDVALPLDKGLCLIDAIRAMAADIRIVVLTRLDPSQCKATALEKGADHFLSKEHTAGLRLIDVIHETIRR